MYKTFPLHTTDLVMIAQPAPEWSLPLLICGLTGAIGIGLALWLRRSARKALRASEHSLRCYVDHVNGRVDHVNGRVEHVNGRVDHVNGRVEHVNGRADHVNGRVEHLNFEFGKLACLPLNHPRRKALVDEVIPPLLPIQARLERVLFPGHEALGDLDWMHKLPNRKFPYSLTDEEGLVLYDLVTRLGLRNGYEIATAFGYSSFYLGLAFKKNGGQLVSMDAYVEESQQDFIYDEQSARRHAEAYAAARRAGDLAGLPEGLRFALAGSAELGLEGTVRYEVGFSPLNVPQVLNGQTLDFAFIDGGHFGEAPCADVDAVLPFLDRERCVLVFHDTHCVAVAKAVFHAAGKLRGEVFSLNTRNRLVLVTRNVDTAKLLGCRDILARQYR
ncbi:MAG: class I SAM-dependent methyltransferase [Nitrospiraceae bacterium]